MATSAIFTVSENLSRVMLPLRYLRAMTRDLPLRYLCAMTRDRPLRHLGAMTGEMPVCHV